jgi:arabinofuranosyltransferase
MIAGCLLHMVYGYTHRGRPGHAWGCDDAYISYRYAENLANGNGLVFNPSETVEGYSNFLYVLLVTPLVMISRDHIYFLSCILNIFFLIAAFWLFRRHVERKWGTADSLTAGVLFALSPILWVWTASGMETPLVLLLQIAMWITVDRLSGGYDRREFRIFAILLILSVLSRADGFIFPVIGIVWIALRRQYKAALYSFAVLILITGAYVGWRYGYYGYLWPNTYYVKISGPLPQRIASAARQLREVLFLKGLLAHFVVVAAVLLAGISGIFKSRNFKISNIDCGPVLMLGLIAYWLYIGGDVFVERFLIIVIPIGILSLFRCVRMFHDRLASIGFPLVMLLFQFTPVLHDSNFDYRAHKYDHWLTLGKFLGRHHPQATLAIDAAGKVPYFSKLYTIDMLGLNDLHIAHLPSSFFQLAHNKYDPDYVLLRRPQLIAAWGHPNRDMRHGMSRSKYEEHGYVLKYLVNSNKTSKEKNIVDVEHASELEYKSLYEEGYLYFVLQLSEDLR